MNVPDGTPVAPGRTLYEVWLPERTSYDDDELGAMEKNAKVHEMLAVNVQVEAELLQGRSKLEKAMQEWFAEQGQRLKFVLWGPGGTGKSTLALKFAARQAKDAALRSPVRLVFALSRGSMVEGYARLLDKLQGKSGGSDMAHEEARQRVHEVLRSPSWSGRWLGVLDDMPAPSELGEAGLRWVLKEFPWAHGRTIITTRAVEWVEDAEDAREVTEAELRVCDRCGQTLGEIQKCGQCRKVYYCSAECQKQAWPEHKLVCEARPAARRSVAKVMGLSGGSFGEEEACSWIKDKVKQWHNDDAGVVELVQHLQCLPLAIGQVAAYARVQSPTWTAGEYLEALREAGKGKLKVGARVKVHSLQKAAEHNGKVGELMEYDEEADRWAVNLGDKLAVRVRHANLSLVRSTDEYPEGLGGVVMLSLGKIRESVDGYGEAAGQAALKMALMAPEGIPLELLSSAERKGVPLLEQYALVTVDGKGLGAMHALTQAVVREQVTGNSQQRSLAAAVVKALAEKLKKFDYMRPTTHFIGRRYASHASAAAGHAREWGLVPAAGQAKPGRWDRGGAYDEQGDGLLTNLEKMCTRAGHFWDAVGGRLGQAQSLYEICLECGVAHYGFNSPYTAGYYSNLGNIYLNQCKHQEALVMYNKAHQIMLKTLPPVHPDLAASYNNLGLVYNRQNKLKEAMEAHTRALKMRLKVQQVRPTREAAANVASSWNNLGAIYGKLDILDGSWQAYREALEIRLKVLGLYHSDTATSYNGLGLVHDKRGKYEEALVAYNKALEIQLKVLGLEHPDVTMSYTNMGNLYLRQGKHEEALEAYSKALEIRLVLMGPEHPDVASSYRSVGNVYNRRGKHEEALQYYRQALDIHRNAFGDLHPEVAGTIHDIGLALKAAGNASEARAMFAEAAALRCAMLGPDHTLTKESEDLAAE